MSSSQVAVGQSTDQRGQTSGRKNYRYLQDPQPRRASNTSSHSSASPSSSASAALRATTTSDGSERQKKRVKVDRACLYCKRSHMACEEQRPCSRCVTRGIGSLCVDDAARADAANGSGSSSQFSHHHHHHHSQSAIQATSSSSLVGDSDLHHTNHDAHKNGSQQLDMHLQDIFASFEGAASSDLPPIDWIGLQHAGPGGHDLQHQGDGSYMHIEVPNNAAAAAAAAGSSSSPGNHIQDAEVGNLLKPIIAEMLPDHQPESENTIRRKRPRPWDHIIDASFDSEDSTVRPYQHAYGYARLERWTRSPISGWSPEAGERIHNLLQREIRPRLRERWQHLSDLQLVEEEQRFLALVDYIRTHVSEAIDVPMVVLRRTWEIVCANEAWASLCQIHVSVFNSGRLCLYQLLSESLAVKSFERYADFVLRNASSPLQSTGHVKFSRRRSMTGQVQSIEVPVKISVEPVMDKNGLPICHIATFSVL